MENSGDNVYIKENSKCAVIVAHPDDEALWCGGLMLMHRDSSWRVVTLCRKSDLDRSPKFHRAMEFFGASGVMGDLDDGLEQVPLDGQNFQDTIMALLGDDEFDFIVTHSLSGEYTRHLRHEETAQAVFDLHKSDKLKAEQLWCFAYEDGNKQYLPRPCDNADLKIKLPDKIWQEKYNIITQIYGFGEESWEARTTPREEAFWKFGFDCEVKK